MYRTIVAIFLALVPLFAGVERPIAKYFVAFLYKGPKFSAESPASVERTVNHGQHIAYIERMHAEGKLFLFGPMLDAGDLGGMYVFRAASIDEARE
jgi:uncharacterized protein YciI